MQRVNEAHERSRLVRTIDDVVWTAVREKALQVALPDGRRLLIGGEVSAYGDDYADPWIYTDIIVTHADGSIEILTYPRDVFAHAGNLVGVTRGADVFIFGTLDEKRHPESAWQPMVLRLDTTSYRIERLSAPTPPRRLLIFPDWELREGNRVVLRVSTRHDAPALAIAFDMETLSWGEPYPYPFPKSDE